MDKNNLKKVLFVLISVPIILGLFLFLNSLNSSKNTKVNTTVENGVQVINISAKNGYSPTVIEAKSDTPTILRIKTQNTYDCSAALSIPSLNYSKFLPPTGESDIQILPQKAGTEILGSCSMGMYGFRIQFV